ncbi:MAG: hypothetical protein LAO21_14205 [Acidobacteriia bacterium]|nr:hypothetical protein [Terriglobia bacterium]
MNEAHISLADTSPPAKAPAGWLRWILPSTAEVCFITLLLIMLFSRVSQYYFLDGDPGWHIRAGQHILETHRIPHSDVFSFSMPHAWWVAYEWGTETIFAALHGRYGLNGVVLFIVLVLASSYTLLYKLLRDEGFSFLLSFPLLLFVILGSSFHWAARPHVVSYLFVIPFFYFLDRFAQGKIAPRRMWILPVMMVLWVNLHPGFIAGVTLVVTFFLGSVIEYIFAQSMQRPALRFKIVSTGRVAALTVAATLFNPNGYKLYIYLYEYFKTVHHLHMMNELTSPIFQLAIFQPFLLAVIALIFLTRYSRYQLRVDEVLNLTIWIALGLVSLRNIPVMFLICAPIYARMLLGLKQPLAEGLSRVPKIRAGGDRFIRRFELAVSLERQFNRHLSSSACVLILIWIVVHHGYWGGQRLMDFRFLEERGYPAAAVEFLKTHRPPGHVFNEWTMGGYLIYNFYPNIKVFVDGRTDLYGEAFTQQYVDLINTPNAVNGKENWKEVFDRYHIQWVMIRPEFALRCVLDSDPDWKRVFLDENCVIFIRQEMG